jgi:fatty-acyl-CoA synthase
MFFNDWLSRRRLYTPDRVAVVDDDEARRYTYEELNARASRLADFLRSPLGVQPRDRVACIATNRIEYIDLYFACGKVGAVLVPLNYRLPPPGILELLQDCHAQLLVYESDFAEAARAAFQSGIVAQLLRLDQVGNGGDRASVAAVVASDESANVRSDAFEADEHDVAMILYTSGTTGRAKGAMIPYRQIHWNAVNTTIGLGLTQNDVAMLNLPMYHTGGWHVLFTPLVQLGGRVILQKRFDAERCNDLIGAEGVTILFGVPTMLRTMCEAPNFPNANLSSVRCAIFGGEPCPPSVINAYQQRGIAMRQGYGLTEAGPNCFSLPAEDAIRKQGSIGFPNFYVGTRLVKGDGSEANAGEVGELWMEGPHVFAGYWADAQVTAEVLHEGWIQTGDLMTRDAEGYYLVVGRKKEMYISGGENVYPSHVERILQTHEAVALAAVIGVPDSKWGETGWAFLKLHANCSLSEVEATSWCRQHLAAFQCPTRIVIMDELPIGPSGKVDKLRLARRTTDHHDSR